MNGAMTEEREVGIPLRNLLTTVHCDRYAYPLMRSRRVVTTIGTCAASVAGYDATEQRISS